jgi:multidrug efflux pump subunit AcrA (membrane-fusion protein)
MNRLNHLKAVAVLAGCVWTASGCGIRNQRSGDKGPPGLGSEGNPIAVSSALAEARQIPLFTAATGSFVAEEVSNVAPPAAGRVVATPVDIGARVEKGQIIVRLDDSDATLRLQQARAAVEQAEAALRQAQARIGFSGGAFKAESVPDVQSARATYESALADARMADADARRYENLVKTGDVSRSNYEKQATMAETANARANVAQKQYESALNVARQGYQGIESAQASLAMGRAQLALSQKTLDDTNVRAPLSGFVTDRPVNVGEFVGTNSKIATVVRVDPVKLQLQVPEQEAGRIRVGMKVLARVESFGSKEFEGLVSVLNPALDPNSRTRTVEARFDNRGLDLRPGMFATARIMLADGEAAVMAPNAAVLLDPNTESAVAFVKEGSKVRIRVVRTGENEGGVIRILSGINGGETVATSNLEQLFDGASVRK